MAANYIKGVGRFSTDRYDFQNHIDGNPPHHKAGIITLDPAIVINSISHTNVQSAIEELAPFAVTVPDASISTKGIVQLAGDLSGTATSVIASASKIQGRAVLSTPPTSGYVLTWNGTAWGPAVIPIQFNAGNDLQGTSTNQEVIGITGISDQTSIKCNTLQFDGDLLSPKITQEETRNVGATLSILAQNSSLLKGGNVSISCGYGLSGTGNIQLQLQPGSSVFSTLLELAEPTSGNHVLSLSKGSAITSAEMPNGTGDRVIYIANAGTTPTVSPVGGVILYSSIGNLCVKQSNGKVRVIGSPILNSPIYYYGDDDDYGYPVVIRKFTVTSPVGSRETLYSYVFDEGPNIVMAEIDAVGLANDDIQIHSSKRVVSFSSVGGGGYFSVLGTESVLHEQENLSTGSFNPVFYDSGFHTQYAIQFMSGSHSSQSVTWSICIKLHFGIYI